VTPRNDSELFVVDSSGWLEYITDDSKAAAFGHYLENESSVVVPSLVIYEVYKHLAKHRGRAVADRFVSQTMHRRVVPMDETIALAAANASLDHRLSGADAIVYATARVCQAQLVTANTHFRGLPGVIIP
jgi:predicted nucleic acid-binding protein